MLSFLVSSACFLGSLVLLRHRTVVQFGWMTWLLRSVNNRHLDLLLVEVPILSVTFGVRMYRMSYSRAFKDFDVSSNHPNW